MLGLILAHRTTPKRIPVYTNKDNVINEFPTVNYIYFKRKFPKRLVCDAIRKHTKLISNHKSTINSNSS